MLEDHLVTADGIERNEKKIPDLLVPKPAADSKSTQKRKSAPQAQRVEI